MKVLLLVQALAKWNRFKISDGGKTALKIAQDNLRVSEIELSTPGLADKLIALHAKELKIPQHKIKPRDDKKMRRSLKTLLDDQSVHGYLVSHRLVKVA